MNFDLTEEQILLRDSLAGYLQRRYDLNAARSASGRAGWHPEIWRELAQDLGLFGAAVSETAGGFGGGPVEIMIVAEELGRALVIEPYVECVVIAPALLRNDAGSVDILAGILSGEAIVVPALLEAGARFDVSQVATAAQDDRISGAKVVVSAGPVATHYLVSAREAGGVSLFLVDAASPDIVRKDYRLIDGRPASDIQFLGSAGHRVGPPGMAMNLIERALDEGVAAACAESVGVIDAMMSATIAYTRQREQFGVPIASFQALQHRMADMASLLERSRSMATMAALSLDLPVGARRKALSAAQAFIASALKTVGEGAIQLHGGIGTTDEIAVSRYFKRATVLQNQFGSAAFHLARMSES